MSDYNAPLDTADFTFGELAAMAALGLGMAARGASSGKASPRAKRKADQIIDTARKRRAYRESKRKK